ncbi:MAG: hypothetical protein B9S32_00890 [Verrucomicrobia bacterium Tous-C9LFEB]|nr:MAG: hypothetical protein B9S32_00890 [Verrucomicrobia bacterium Tous-C9LFEB]
MTAFLENPKPSDSTLRIPKSSALIPVLVIDSPDKACRTISCLMECGIDSVELAWRTPHFLTTLQAVRKEFDQLQLGVGTILTPDQASIARDVGADFGLSPGINQPVIEAAQKLSWPFVPGVMTPSDISLAMANGCRLMKFFPAETSGGTAHLKVMTSPFLHLEPRFIVLGGITEQSCAAYLKIPTVTAIGGSWLAPTDDIDNHRWNLIAARTRSALAIIQQHRPQAT